MLEVKGETVYSWVKKALWAWELLRILAKQKGKARPRAEACQANIL